MIDDSEETCWSSDSGFPQFVQYGPFTGSSAGIGKLCIMFQGGYAAKEGQLLVKFANTDNWILQDTIRPTDSSVLQTFCPAPLATSSENSIEYFKLLFDSSYDPYGRIVIYKLAVE